MFYYLIKYSFFLYFFIFGITGSRVRKSEIPGCPDLSSLPGDLSALDTEQLSNLKCFCSPVEDQENEELEGINVNCIYGSKLEDLLDALNAIDEANQTVYRVSIEVINQ